MRCQHCDAELWRTRSGLVYCPDFWCQENKGATEAQQDEVCRHLWSVSSMLQAIRHDPKAARHGFWTLEKPKSLRQWQQAYASTIRSNEVPLHGAPALWRAIKAR